MGFANVKWGYDMIQLDTFYQGCNRRRLPHPLRYLVWYLIKAAIVGEIQFIEVSPPANNDQGLGEGLRFGMQFVSIYLLIVKPWGLTPLSTCGKAPKGNACERRNSTKNNWVRCQKKCMNIHNDGHKEHTFLWVNLSKTLEGYTKTHQNHTDFKKRSEKRPAFNSHIIYILKTIS